MKRYIVAAAFAVLFSQGAIAQSSSNPLDTRVFKNGLWLGGGVSYSSLDIDGTSYGDEAWGYNLGVGYQFANYFGVNARWRDLGGFKDQGVKVDLDGYTLGFAAGYPVTGRVGVIGGIGYYDFDGDADAGGGLSVSGSEDGLYLSAGIASEIGRIVIQPQVVWYDTDDADLWTLELNAYWKFELGN